MNDPWGLFNGPYGWEVHEIERETALTLYADGGTRRFALSKLIARFPDKKTALDFRSRERQSRDAMYGAHRQATEQHNARLHKLRIEAQGCELDRAEAQPKQEG